MKSFNRVMDGWMECHIQSDDRDDEVRNPTKLTTTTMMMMMMMMMMITMTITSVMMLVTSAKMTTLVHQTKLFQPATRLKYEEMNSQTSR